MKLQFSSYFSKLDFRRTNWFEKHTHTHVGRSSVWNHIISLMLWNRQKLKNDCHKCIPVGMDRTWKMNTIGRKVTWNENLQLCNSGFYHQQHSLCTYETTLWEMLQFPHSIGKTKSYIATFAHKRGKNTSLWNNIHGKWTILWDKWKNLHITFTLYWTRVKTISILLHLTQFNKACPFYSTSFGLTSSFSVAAI